MVACCCVLCWLDYTQTKVPGGSKNNECRKTHFVSEWVDRLCGNVIHSSDANTFNFGRRNNTRLVNATGDMTRAPSMKLIRVFGLRFERDMMYAAPEAVTSVFSYSLVGELWVDGRWDPVCTSVIEQIDKAAKTVCTASGNIYEVDVNGSDRDAYRVLFH